VIGKQGVIGAVGIDNLKERSASPERQGDVLRTQIAQCAMLTQGRRSRRLFVRNFCGAAVNHAS